MTKKLDEYLSPPHKVLALLKTGHERLRQKYTALRVKLRTTENQVRAVTKSRDSWRVRAETAESELKLLKKND
ncbi:hypothetical protein LF1_50670 [Rubripirellula obstinata]|uniref:Uncharacterized protein n=1 Tax=Rubripirellula obstinata TaxID=406547 RepID=A0A5B1CKY9_9BACT|nr:hypothetical protein [Rubripirellula obstinata]KAA1257619.1 hypothetical protein LF1_01070 [Rubripirellula obstinata]KAA1258492.1 hypothetical protein LF1_10120 [Rubripirellula obstinata]KAA1260112.1 hypothetical protein LF1_26510 [Rubripirellula obstinata]KAA1260409.1 hypothetical protein LF1_29490 [Rubripirellula obstinata]KAA1260791.1 hypothetical protein LF1_33330 [Rubripirellula obstinata]